MAHFSRISNVVIDLPEETHSAGVMFWRDALGVPLPQFERFPEFHGGELSADGLGLLIQRLGEGPPRVHLDIHASDRPAEVARLERHGAVVVDDTGGWTIMRDPAGLVFCVVPDKSLNESNAREWVD